MANGSEKVCRISEVQANSHTDSQVTVEVKGKRYLMRVNNLNTDPTHGRYLNLDLLFATLNPHSEGVYIKGEKQVGKENSKERKKAE